MRLGKRATEDNQRAYVEMWERLMRGRFRSCIDCCHAVPWRGFQEAMREGWTWTLGRRGVLWKCADCQPGVQIGKAS